MRTDAGKAESISLARTIPIIKAAWLKCRLGMGTRFKKHEDCWAEFRDSCILFYRVPVKNSDIVGVDQAAATELTQYCPLPLIEVLPLRHANASPSAKTLSVRVVRADHMGSVDIKFSNLEQFEEWTTFIQESINLRRATLADFIILRHLGRGASGHVYLVLDRTTHRQFALKVIQKSSVMQSEDSYCHAMNERFTLELTSKHPFILEMRFAFQDRDQLFLVMDFCEGGDLFEYLSWKEQPMEEAKAKYVMAELLLALQHVHGLGIVYRDLKLENILLDDRGHVRLGDFGLSKLLRRGDSSELVRTMSVCGTRAYVAPEMLEGVPYDTSIDLWAFGILVFEILSKRTPFYSEEKGKMFEDIRWTPVIFPEEMSLCAQDLIRGLLQRDISQRLGNGDRGLDEVKEHAWFAGINWDALALKKDHTHSITGEVRRMILELNSGSGDETIGLEKSGRSLKCEKAMETLQMNAIADAKNMSEASPPLVYELSHGHMPGAKSTKVLRAQKARKRAHVIAGYSFNGEWNLNALQSG